MICWSKYISNQTTEVKMLLLIIRVCLSVVSPLQVLTWQSNLILNNQMLLVQKTKLLSVSGKLAVGETNKTWSLSITEIYDALQNNNERTEIYYCFSVIYYFINNIIFLFPPLCHLTWYMWVFFLKCCFMMSWFLFACFSSGCSPGGAGPSSTVVRQPEALVIQGLLCLWLARTRCCHWMGLLFSLDDWLEFEYAHQSKPIRSGVFLEKNLNEPEAVLSHFPFASTHVCVCICVFARRKTADNSFRTSPQSDHSPCAGATAQYTMFEQLGLIGTIRDEEESPEEPDTDSDQEVSVSGDTTRTRWWTSCDPGGLKVSNSLY